MKVEKGSNLEIEFSDAFLSTLAEAYTIFDWALGDKDEIIHFVEWCFDLAGEDPPDTLYE